MGVLNLLLQYLFELGGGGRNRRRTGGGRGGGRGEGGNRRRRRGHTMLSYMIKRLTIPSSFLPVLATITITNTTSYITCCVPVSDNASEMVVAVSSSRSRRS